MENGEKVIRMLHHMTIGLQYWSCECTPSWASDNEEEYTEVTEKYQRKHPLTPSEYESLHYMFILLSYAFQVNSLYDHVSPLINTPVCCMYFTSSNINLATYFS